MPIDLAPNRGGTTGGEDTRTPGRCVDAAPRGRQSVTIGADVSTRQPPPYGEADGDADAEPDPDAEGEIEPDSEGEADVDADGTTELEAGREGSGTGVGSGMSRDGMPANDSTKIRTKMPRTARIQGRANRSSREGSAPR